MEKTLNKVLYVEDNMDDRFFMRYTFEKIIPEIEIDEIDNGEDALNALRNEEQKSQYQLIFLDIKLPKYSAFEVLSILKSENKHLPINKILILSTSNTEFDRKQANEFGIKEVISKPIDEKLLKNILNEFGFDVSSRSR